MSHALDGPILWLLLEERRDGISNCLNILSMVITSSEALHITLKVYFDSPDAGEIPTFKVKNWTFYSFFGIPIRHEKCMKVKERLRDYYFTVCKGCLCMLCMTDSRVHKKYFPVTFFTPLSKFGRWTSILWDEVEGKEGEEGRMEDRKHWGKWESSFSRIRWAGRRMGYMRNHKGGSKNWHYHACCCAIHHWLFEAKLSEGKHPNETGAAVLSYLWLETQTRYFNLFQIYHSSNSLCLCFWTLLENGWLQILRRWFLPRNIGFISHDITSKESVLFLFLSRPR